MGFVLIIVFILLVCITLTALENKKKLARLERDQTQLRKEAAALWDENKQLKIRLGAASEMEFSQMEAKRLEAVAESTRHKVFIDQQKLEINPYLIENEALKVQVKELKQGIKDRTDSHYSSVKNISMAHELVRLTDVCETIIADQKLADLEIEYLQKWLNENSIHDAFCSYLSKQIKEVLSDGKITPTERRKLFETIENGVHCYSQEIEFIPPDTKQKKTRSHSNKAKLSPLHSAKTVQFTYEDSKGNITTRQVSSFYIDGIYLNGFCHKANAVRTFIIDRICGSVVDMDTGEIFNP